MKLLKIIFICFVIYFIRRFFQAYKVMKQIQEAQVKAQAQQAQANAEAAGQPHRANQDEVVDADFRVID